MINVKRWCLAILVFFVLVISSAAVWIVYYGNIAPKTPLRAKQVTSEYVGF
ncbi:MAG: hypothetical protein H6Q73_1087 [Firmicutes bacterium]|nr:hypothetical protein [Bacillota bacterium]